MSRSEECSTILGEIEAGRMHAAELLPLVYDELRALARAAVRGDGARAEIEPTMLVHEAYLRLVDADAAGWNGRGHFFGAAALAMRRILVEQARRRQRTKHGAGRVRVTLSGVADVPALSDEDLLVIEEAVERLERTDALKGRIVNLRFFSGRSMEETARLLDVSLSTVERQWRFIRSWLKTELDAPRNS